MVLNQILEPVLRPLLDSTGAFGTVIIVSVFVSLLTTLVYKFATDQTKLKSLKADLKRYQNKLKAQKDNPEKALKIQKDMMKVNGEYMKHSLKSTLYTFLPIILFFGWLQANLAFAPLLPQEMFDVTANFADGVVEPATIVLPSEIMTNSNKTQIPVDGVVTWSVQGPEGIYDASIQVGDEEKFFSFIVSDNVVYVDPISEFEDATYLSSIVVGNQKLLVFEGIPVLGAIPWIKTFGWFGAYFLFSIIFSTTLRKALNLA